MPFQIDLSEPFPHLPRAPIVEAVIHWQARAEAKLSEDELRPQLQERLPEYTEIHSQHAISFEATGSPADSSMSHRTRWQGYRLERTDGGHYVAQFTTDGLVFSRLAPYDRWETFEEEGLRLWDVFVELARPASPQRLGVRFINRIPLSASEKPSGYLLLMPDFPTEFDLPVEKFVHRDMFAVPETPYHINLLRTIQPAEGPGKQGLLFDIDVFAADIGSIDRERLLRYLAEMRWLKNRAFFSSITEHARQSFEKGKS